MRFSKSAIPWRQSDYGARLKWTRVQTTDSIFDPFTNRIRSFHEFSLKRGKKKSAKYLNVRIWSISIVIQRLFLLFFLSSFFIFKERIMGSGSKIRFEFIDVFVSTLFRISINLNLYSFVHSKFIWKWKTNLDSFSG